MSSSRILQHIYKRRTISRSIKVTGIGLHTGERVMVALHPYDDGVKVKKGKEIFPISLDHVAGTSLGILLSYNDFRLRTPEHLLGAMAMAGITDCLVELLMGEEIPILDGSAKEWYHLLTSSEPLPIGHLVLEEEDKPLIVLENGKVSWLLGWDDIYHLKQPFQIAYFQPLKENFTIIVYRIAWKGVQQDAVIRLPMEDPRGYSLISEASTFAHLQDVTQILRAGFSKGASLDNVLIKTFKGYTRPRKLKEELVHHKLLDMLGDTFLLGIIPRGIFYVLNGGHELHLKLVKLLKRALKRIIKLNDGKGV